MGKRLISLATARYVRDAADVLGANMRAVGNWTASDGDSIFLGSGDGAPILVFGRRWTTLLVDGERVRAEPDAGNAAPVLFRLT